MLDDRDHIALGIAYAMLAGGPLEHELRARTREACGSNATWIDELAREIAQTCAMTWPFLRVHDLAQRIAAVKPYRHAWLGIDKPRIARWILRPERRLPAPMAFDDIDLPDLGGAGDLAAWLGIDAATLDWFCAHPALRRQAPMHRQHYRWLVRRKPAGGVRVLAAPQSRLRALQRRLLDGLLAKLPMHEAAIGFVRGRSVIDHARLHAGQAIVACFDLRDFFGSVRASRVHATLATLGYANGVCRAITALVTCRAPEALVARLLDDRLIDHEHALRLRDAHLPQGAPTSPALANACAFNLDLRLDGLARAMGATYSRYADDLAISGERLLAARRLELEALVGAIAREEGFALNHHKSRSATRAGAQRLCGLTCNEHPNLPRREFDRLKALLHRCVRDGPSAHAHGSDDFRAHLLGRVAWARQVNAAKAARLARDLARIDWQR